MDTPDILKSLSNLEQSLQGVESARQQVEKTVAAYEGARLQITNLIQEFVRISKELNTVVFTIRNNQQVLEGAISEKVESVFNNINTRVTVIGGELDSINNTFASNCSKTATSVKDNVSEALKSFDEKVQNTLGDITKTLFEFKGLVSAIESEFKTNTNNSVTSVDSTLKSITEDFQDKLNIQLKDFADLKKEIEGIVNLQKRFTSDVFAKIETETKSIKENISELDNQINKLTTHSESNHKELIDILSAILQGNNPSAEKLSARFNSVDGSLGAVKDGVSSVSSQLGTATIQIIDENKQTLLSEVTAVKAENANIKKMVVFCLVAISISILFNLIILIC